MSLKNIPQYERPREKAIKNGIETLSNAELIAILLHNGTIGISAIELANQLLIKFGGLAALMETDFSQLQSIKGINQVKAIELKACYELASRLNQVKEIHPKYVIKEPIDVYNRYHLKVNHYCQEIFYVLFLNIKLQVIKEEKLFAGGYDASIVDLNLLFKKALLCNAKKIICFHNHPSGETMPSEADCLLTEKMIQMGIYVQIKVMDHIIIGKNQYYSFAQKKQFLVKSNNI